MSQPTNQMASKPILKLLMTMAIPPMISMLIQSLYNIIDSIYVAQISDNALTAVSLVFPLQNIVLAVAVGFGVSISAYISINLGAKDPDAVNKTASHGFVLTLIHSLLFVVCGLLFTKPFLRMFTDNPEIFKWGYQYGYIVTTLAFGQLFMLLIEKIYQASGNMMIPMIVQLIGCIINVVLDPILIFGKLGFPALGVVGAAIATVFAQICTFVIYIFLFRKRNYGIHIQLKGFRFDKHVVKQLYSIAFPSALMMSLPSILIGILNSILIKISVSGVAVLGIYFKLQTFVYMPAGGVIQGMRPIISYNYGAGRKDRVRKTILCSLSVIAIIMVFGTLISLLFPNQILTMFNASDDLLSMGSTALRIISLGFVVSTFSIVLSGAFEALGMGTHSLVISLLRQLVLLIPLSIGLSIFYGVTGVWIAFPVAEFITTFVALFFMKKYIFNKE